MISEHSNYEKSFRDSLATIAESGKRLWVYAKQPKGKFYRYRTAFASFLLVVLFVTPFIKVNNEPFLLLNIFERKFILFGVIFWPQDSYLFALMMLSGLVFIILFTVIFGRLWCGWACPQTIFLEHIFRRIEFWIEGTASQQRKLNEGNLDFNFFWRKTLKYLVFIFISIAIISTLSSYLLGMDAVISNYKGGFGANPRYFTAIGFFSLAFFGIYSWFREQVCTIMCPYGRLQGVLLDSNSILVSYDYKRGEPRGKGEKSEDGTENIKGDCIDCHLCTAVCPTRIDIRNGTQLECVQCTACIDACDATMERINKPKGLIRYTSEKHIAEGKKLEFTTRILGYLLVLTAILVFLTSLLLLRTEVETTVLRTPGLLFQLQDNNTISNLYNYKIVNKTRSIVPITFSLQNSSGSIKNMQGDTVFVKPGKRTEGVLFVYFNNDSLKLEKMPIVFEIFVGNSKIETFNSTFVGLTRKHVTVPK